MKEARMLGMHVPAAARRLGLVALLVFVAVLSAKTTYAQAAPEQQAQPAANNPYVFTTDGALLLQFIKPDKTADFEAILAKLKEGLMKSDKPERQEMAKSWKIYKAQETGAGMAAIYVSVIAPAVKGADYTISTILAETFPAEANELYKRYVDVFATPPGNLLHLTLFSDLAQ
jgi:hypothetical protein